MSFQIACKDLVLKGFEGFKWRRRWLRRVLPRCATWMKTMKTSDHEAWNVRKSGRGVGKWSTATWRATSGEPIDIK